LKYLDKHKIALGTHIEVKEIEKFDSSISVFLNNQFISISNKIATNLYIQ
jgi:DtxR family Mn-dependent transcriptional regulator